MLLSVVLLELAELERPCEPTFVPEQFVQLLARERQDRREEDLERIHDAERHVEDRPGPFTVFLDRGPRRLVVDVLVSEAREAHHFCERLLELRLRNQCAHSVEAGLDRRENLAVLVSQLAGRRYLTEVAVRVGERAVDEIAPVGE